MNVNVIYMDIYIICIYIYIKYINLLPISIINWLKKEEKEIKIVLLNLKNSHTYLYTYNFSQYTVKLGKKLKLYISQQ